MSTLATPRAVTLGELIESYAMLDRYQNRLRILRYRINQVRIYLAKSDSNLSLGRVQHERVRQEYSATLAGLRTARRQAYRHLGLIATAHN